MSALAILRSDGWLVFLWLPCCVVAGTFHLVWLSVRGRPSTAASARLEYWASVLFLLAFLLQVDEGDGPRWLIMLPMLRIPDWWPMWVNFFAFVPLVSCWIQMLREGTGHTPSITGQR